MIGIATLMVIGAEGAEVTPRLSFAVTVKEGVVAASVGPAAAEITPVLALRLSPAGNWPEETAQLLYGAWPVPALAANVRLYCVPMVALRPEVGAATAT